MAELSGLSQQELIEKAKRRAILREEFLKKSSDPFKHATGEAGAVFDPAIQRFSAMRVSQFEYFRPNIKTAFVGLAIIVIPMFAYGYLLKSSRDETEAQLRRGEIAYKDRRFKFI